MPIDKKKSEIEGNIFTKLLNCSHYSYVPGTRGEKLMIHLVDVMYERQ